MKTKNNTCAPRQDFCFSSIEERNFLSGFRKVKRTLPVEIGPRRMNTNFLDSRRISWFCIGTDNTNRAVYRESHDNWPAGAMLFLQSITSSIGSYWKMLQLQTDSWASRTSEAYDFGHKYVSSRYKHLTKSCQRRTSEKKHFFDDFQRPSDGRGP